MNSVISHNCQTFRIDYESNDIVLCIAWFLITAASYPFHDRRILINVDNAISIIWPKIIMVIKM